MSGQTFTHKNKLKHFLYCLQPSRVAKWLKTAVSERLYPVVACWEVAITLATVFNRTYNFPQGVADHRINLAAPASG